MSERMCSVSPADTGCSMESPAPDQHDPHSSEEELEVINSTKDVRPDRPLRATSVCLPEKRKWSQVGDSYGRMYTPENEENMSQYGNLSPSSPCFNQFHVGDTVHIEHSGSSDDEVHNLLDNNMSTPVQFRTSPPLEALKLGRKTPNNKIRSLSPPPKLLHYEVSSPRKRPRHPRHTHIQRPYLDFEKMQQVI